MSISEPCSPRKASDTFNSKWFATSSCTDLAENESTSVINVAISSTMKEKKRALENFILENEDCLDDHLETLRAFSRSRGGLVDDGIRRIVWPVLARNLQNAVDSTPVPYDCDELSEEKLKAHKEWHQVELDVHRTLARFPRGVDDLCRMDLQAQLTPMIIKVISSRSGYQYYQGLHDVFLTLLLVVGREAAEEMGWHLVTKGIFHDFLALPLQDGVCKQLELIYVILSRADPELERILRQAELGPIFALSWPLTWFSHSLHSYDEIVRVFDVFLSSEPLLPIYLSAVCVLFRKNAVLKSEREMPILHQILGTLPKSLPIDSLVSDALYLTKLMPPVLLQGKFLNEYKERTPNTPNIRPVISSISRYAVQMIFVAGAVSAAAGYYLFAKNLS